MNRVNSLSDDPNWTSLPKDIVLDLFTRLNYNDRASLSSTCSTWRSHGSSSFLWSSLDIRAYEFNPSIAASLAPRCANLEKLKFRGVETADALIHLKAKNLVELSGDFCWMITDATLSMIAARHEALEVLQLGRSELITSDAIRVLAICCPKLRKLHLSRLRDVASAAIESLAEHCTQLSDLAFIDCMDIDVEALGKVSSLRYLSVAGTTIINWNVAIESWKKLPKLTGLDVSGTSIYNIDISKLLESSKSLEVVCALHCPFVSYDRVKGKALLTRFPNIFDELSSIFDEKPKDIFSYWRSLIGKDKSIDEKMHWIEWSISLTLQRRAELEGMDDFWMDHGAKLLLILLKSSQEDVQERAVKALADIIVIDDEDPRIDLARVDLVLRGGGIRLLLDLANSSREVLQSEATKTIPNLAANAEAAKAIAEEGWINVLIRLAKSTTRLVAVEAIGALWSLSEREECKTAIAQAGGVKALVELIFRWKITSHGIMERAAGALANLAADDKCSADVSRVGGVGALVKLVRDSEYEGVQEQAARGLANMAAHGECNKNNTIVGQVHDALEALVKLTKSIHEEVKREAAGALWHLSFHENNRESIVTLGGIEALVTLAKSYATASTGLQERVAGAIWGLSVSEANSIAIGDEGGIPPLVALAKSEVVNVHETAAGALWNLSFYLGNALEIVELGGVPTLIQLCSCSPSRMARFISALALAYIFDGRVEEMVGARTTSANVYECFFLAAKARIHEAGHIRCSGPEIGRFVTMLRIDCPTLKSCAAFALFQFTVPKARHARHHASLMQNAEEAIALKSVAADTKNPPEAQFFAKFVLRNLVYHAAKL
ncbi:hypothetical protein AALP_AA5G259200 [Arabis alpina]|uniref:F-box domain-containing protein n=1 Tax=Arabis alpina TaxID=50452 RepID=A0A087GZE1_ARAAL|nr:hypothetical protein AALP_AA5G259200 [Arabis alpina]